jgi:hypothetical protein
MQPKRKKKGIKKTASVLQTSFFQMRRSQAFEIIVPHVVATLPDSMMKRFKLLGALLACAPPNHPCAGRLREMEYLLQEHQRLQNGWTVGLELPKETKKNSRI